MPTKRPTTAQIAARQRIIIEGIADSGLSDRQAARKFGVTPRELNRFLGLNASTLRKQYNRSPTTREMYSSGERHAVKSELGLRYLPHRYPYEPQRIAGYVSRTNASKETRERYIAIGKRIQRVYYTAREPRALWKEHTTKNNLPQSIKLIDKMRQQGKISALKYRQVMSVHSIIYAKSPKVTS